MSWRRFKTKSGRLLRREVHLLKIIFYIIKKFATTSAAVLPQAAAAATDSFKIKTAESVLRDPGTLKSKAFVCLSVEMPDRGILKGEVSMYH